MQKKSWNCIIGREVGIVIELKYPKDGNLEKGCREALELIENKVMR